MFNEKELETIDPKVYVMYKWIRKNIKDNSVILELGSGITTNELGKHYKLFSIEHDYQWVNKYRNTTYIHAPLKKYDNDAPIGFPQPNNGWYDIIFIKDDLPKSYDLIIIDGPVGATPDDVGRGGFYKYLDMFNTNVPMIFHDANRAVENTLVKMVSKKLHRQYKYLDNVGDVGTAVIL